MSKIINLIRKTINTEYRLWEIKEIKSLGIGMDNTCYLLICKDKKYVVKIYGIWDFTKDYVIYESEIMNLCHNKWLLVPKIYFTKDQSLCTKLWNNFLQISDFIQSKKPKFQYKTILEIWEQMAKMHYWLTKYSDNFEKRIRKCIWSDLKYFDELEYYFDPNDYSEEISEIIKQSFVTFKENKEIYKKLQTWIIHNDMCYDNFVLDWWNLLWFFDFTDLTSSRLIQDVTIIFYHLYFYPKWRRNHKKVINIFFS